MERILRELNHPSSEKFPGPLKTLKKTIRTRLDHFIFPSGTTAYDAAFQAAQLLGKKRQGFTSILNISDGLPNDLEKARQKAAGFPELKMQYGQIIFGEKIHPSDLVEQFYSERMTVFGIKQTSTRYEKYVEHFSSIAKAAQGDQVILWVVNQLTAGMLSLADVSMGRNYLMFDSQYQKLFRRRVGD
ncbi:hypothetical protein WDW89_01485 [Deltaproteobacteria bacterium TL4]